MLRPTAIGERIRAARYAAQLTQTELAADHYSKSYISAIERSKMIPSLHALQYLAGRLAVPISSLLGEGGTTTEAPDEAHVQEPPTCDEQESHEEEQARLLSEAEALLRDGRCVEAIARFALLGQSDRLRAAYEQYAHVLAEAGRFEEAYAAMQRALH
jgi:transcriptional regulator with XRE-family HTH domain